MVKGYLSLDKLEAYKLSRQLSVFAWDVYKDLRIILNGLINSAMKAKMEVS